MAKRALVLSGGGIFGAWQAGVWSVLSSRFHPDMIVGASVGSLNGYAIASGNTPEQILALWRRPQAAGFRQLPNTIRFMVQSRPPQIEFAVVLVDALRLREETFIGAQITWRHLVASCSVPGLMRPQRIGGKWFTDGGLLNVVPLAPAIALGATEVLVVNALPEFPLPALRPMVGGFRSIFRKKLAIPPNVSVTTLVPSKTLGTLGDACFWSAENVERWYIQGAEDACGAIARGLIPSNLLKSKS